MVMPPKELGLVKFPEPFPGFEEATKSVTRDIRAAEKRMQEAEVRLTSHQKSKWLWMLSGIGAGMRQEIGLGRNLFAIPREDTEAFQLSRTLEGSWQLEKDRLLSERNEAIRQLGRVTWFDNFYKIAPELIKSGVINSYEDYLERIKSDPTGILDEEDIELARDRISKMSGTRPVVAREDAPDWLQITPEQESEVREAFALEPKPPTSIHGISVNALVKSLTMAPKITMPEEWTPEDMLKFASIMDIPEEEMMRAVDITELLEPYSSAIVEQEARIKSILAGEEEWQIPEMELWQRALFTVFSPFQTVADVIRPYLENFSYPYVGFIAYGVSRFLSGTQEIEEQYAKFKSQGYNWWDAMSEAYQDWSLPWYLKLPFEILTDPITYTPGLLLSVPGKLLTKIPTVATRTLGHGFIALNKGLWYATDLPFDAFKAFWASLPKTFNQATRMELNSFRDLLVAASSKQSGHVVSDLTAADLTKTLERAMKDFAADPMKQGDVFVDLGAELVKHAPLDENAVRIWARSLGQQIDEVTPKILADVEDVISDAVLKMGSPAENAKRIAMALSIEDTPKNIGKLMRDIGVITSKYTNRVPRAIEIGKRAKVSSALQMTDYLVSTQKGIIEAIERSSYAKGKMLEGITLALMNKVNTLERGIWRLTLDRWLVRPFAEAYLGSVAYPIWNVFEGIGVSILEGVVPHQAKQEAFQRMFLGIRGVDSRVMQWSASDVAGMLGTMPGRGGAISLLPGKVPEKILGLKTPKWLAGKDYFEWIGRKWIELSDVWGTGLRANFLIRKMANFLAEYSYEVAGHDLNVAFNKLVKRAYPKNAIAKKALGLNDFELKQEMYARVTSGLKSEVLGMKDFVSNSKLMQGEALKILREATELSPQARTLGEQMIARGEAFGFLKPLRESVIDWEKVVFDSQIDADAQKIIRELIDSLSLYFKPNIRRIEINPRMLDKLDADGYFRRGVLTFRDVDDIVDSDLLFHEVAHSFLDTEEGASLLADYAEMLGIAFEKDMNENFASAYAAWIRGKYTESLGKNVVDFFERNLPRQGSAIDDINSFVKTLADQSIADLRAYPSQAPVTFRFMADQIEELAYGAKKVTPVTPEVTLPAQKAPRRGVLWSSRAHIADVNDVATGTKPAALVDDFAAEKARKLGLDVVRVPTGAFGILEKRLAWIVVPKGKVGNADAVLGVLSKYPISAGSRPPMYHVEMGRAMGYSENDIAYFIEKNFGAEVADSIFIPKTRAVPKAEVVTPTAPAVEMVKPPKVKPKEVIKSTYIRIGDLPKGGKSEIGYSGKFEKGVSAYEATYDAITKKYYIEATEDNVDDLAEYMDWIESGKKKVFELEGREIGEGSTGEPLLDTAKIKRAISPDNVIIKRPDGFGVTLSNKKVVLPKAEAAIPVAGINTASDLMQIFQHYEVMADTASHVPMRLLSQVMEEADELKRVGKFNKLETLWRTSRKEVETITDDIADSLNRVRAVIQSKSSLLTSKQQNALNSLLERQTARLQLQEQFLKFDGRLLDDFWALPKAMRTAEAHTELRAYRLENIIKYKGEDAVLGAGDFLERKSYSELYHQLPKPKLFRVDASNRALSADDAAKVMGANVDALTTGLMESMTFQDKPYFIQMIKQAAEAHPTYYKGFTEEKLGQLYDDIIRGIKMNPEADIATQKILQQVEGVKQKMILLRMSKSISPAEEKALNEWIDDVAKGMDDIIAPAGKGMVTPAQWDEVRQKASESAHKEYYKAFADYTNENIIDAVGKSIYPYWTYHLYRPFFLWRTFLRKPGVAAAWGRYYEYSDYGYQHIPGTDLEFSPAVGSVFGATFGLARHDFKTYYENLGVMGEVLDWTQRLGFFPGVQWTLPISLTPILSGRAPELGNVLAPIHRSGLNTLVGSKIPGVSGSAKWLKERVFHENFNDYYTATIVSSKQVAAGGTLIGGQAGVDLWFKKMRGESLTDEEQQLWDSASEDAAWIETLRSQFPSFRMRSEEMLTAYEQVVSLIEAQTGMTAKMQEDLWRHNLRPSDVIGGLPLELRTALDQMWQWRIYFGRGAILMPPEYSDLYNKIDSYYDKVERFQIERLTLQTDANAGFLTPTKELHFDGGEWRREYANNWSAYISRVKGLEADPEFADVIDALTPEGQIRLAKELGFTPPPVDPMQEAIRLYFDIEMHKKIDPYTGEEDDNYLRFWIERESVRMVLPENQRDAFDAYIRRYQTPMEVLFKEVTNKYLKGYQAISRIVLEEFTDEEKALIAEFYATTTTLDRKKEIQEFTSHSGKQLISYWDSRRTNVRQAMRRASPELDFWLYVFGYTKPLTDAAKEMVRVWEKDRTSIVRGITETPMLEDILKKVEEKKSKEVK